MLRRWDRNFPSDLPKVSVKAQYDFYRLLDTVWRMRGGPPNGRADRQALDTLSNSSDTRLSERKG